MPPKRKVADVGDDKSSPTDLTGASSFSDKEKEQSIEAKKNPEYMDPEKYKVYPNYAEFKNNTHVTTISKLIAKRVERNPDVLTLDSFKLCKQAKRTIPFLFCQILRISTPAKSNDPTNSFFKKNKFDRKTNNKPSYKKCILLADLADPNQLTGVLLEQSNEDHNMLFARDLSLDNVAVGQRFVILSPKLTGSQLKNGAWVITTNRPLEFVSAPKIPIRPLKCEQIGHEIRYFTMKGKQILLHEDDTIDPIKTKCNFHACDRQNAKAMGIQSTCGCWMQSSRSENGPKNTVMMFSFYFPDENKKLFRVADFTSLNTSKLFFKNNNILADVKTLQNNAVYDYVQNQWRKIIEFVNSNGGWTLVGWYIRAVLEDEEKDETDEVLFRTNVKINISHLTATTKAGLEIPEDSIVDQDRINDILAEQNTPTIAPDDDLL